MPQYQQKTTPPVQYIPTHIWVRNDVKHPQAIMVATPTLKEIKNYTKISNYPRGGFCLGINDQSIFIYDNHGSGVVHFPRNHFELADILRYTLLDKQQIINDMVFVYNQTVDMLTLYPSEHPVIKQCVPLVDQSTFTMGDILTTAYGNTVTYVGNYYLMTYGPSDHMSFFKYRYIPTENKFHIVKHGDNFIAIDNMAITSVEKGTTAPKLLNELDAYLSGIGCRYENSTIVGYGDNIQQVSDYLIDTTPYHTDGGVLMYHDTDETYIAKYLSGLEYTFHSMALADDGEISFSNFANVAKGLIKKPGLNPQFLVSYIDPVTQERTPAAEITGQALNLRSSWTNPLSNNTVHVTIKDIGGTIL